MKDTKLISKRVSLITEGDLSNISTRRLRNDECTIKTQKGQISIGSYIETGILDLSTCGGDVTIGKKLGIGIKGLAKADLLKDSTFKVSSIFSKMASLPNPKYEQVTLSTLQKDIDQFLLNDH